jgi:hypothetical protein
MSFKGILYEATEFLVIFLPYEPDPTSGSNFRKTVSAALFNPLLAPFT